MLARVRVWAQALRNCSASSLRHCHPQSGFCSEAVTWMLSPSLLIVEKETESPVPFPITSRLGLHGPVRLPPRDVRLKWSPWVWICTSLETASSMALACSPQGSNSLDHQRFYNNYICSSLEIAQKKFVGTKKKKGRDKYLFTLLKVVKIQNKYFLQNTYMYKMSYNLIDTTEINSYWSKHSYRHH